VSIHPFNTVVVVKSPKGFSCEAFPAADRGYALYQKVSKFTHEIRAGILVLAQRRPMLEIPHLP
jgi:hypothetical protein